MNTTVKFVFTASHLSALSEYQQQAGAKQIERKDSKTAGLSVVVYGSGKVVFYLTFSHRKVRHRIRLGDFPALTVSEARKMSLSLKADIQRGKNPLGNIRKQEVTFALLAKRYLEHTRDIKLSHKDDESKCRLHLVPVFGNKPLSAITTVMVERYHASAAKKLSPASANRHLALIKALFSFAKKQQLVWQSPAHGISPFPEETKEKKYMTQSEVEVFLQALSHEPNREAAAMLEFMLLTGVRSGTARQARLEHFDQNMGTMLIPMTKSGKGQRLWLSERAQLIVKAQQDKFGHTGYLFRGIDLISKISNPSDVMKRVCYRANIAIFTPHALRHTFAVLAMQSGASIFQLKEILNHQSVSTTEVYAALSDTFKRELAQQVSNMVV
ncbi:tyrosine-type recombinase/integrase [Vibrio vulnificus]|nr:tyrosine-type recombinase/integrase [Vibrio vulnificus]